jgi:hypothetical protein
VGGILGSRSITTVALAFVVLLCGCSAASPAGGGPAPPPVPVPTPASAAQLNYPISAYEFSAMQQNEWQYIDSLLIKQCMAQRGFQIYQTLNSGSVALGVRIIDEFDSRVWGLSDAVTAREYGYHLPPWVSGSAKPQALAGGSGPAAQTEACIGQAGRRLAAAGAGNGEQASQLVGQIDSESFYRARADRRVRAVFAKWSACMGRYGYSYRDPFQAAAAFNLNRPATGTEIQTAVQDVTCARQVNVLGVAYAVQSDYQNALIEKYAVQLAAVKTQVQRQEHALVTVAAKYGIGG